MKFTADTADLARAVRAVRKATPGKSAWGPLQGVKVEALDGVVAFTATDLGTGRRVEIEAKVETAGEILMPPRFPSVVAAATADVTTVDDGAVTSGRSRWRLDLLAIDDYPAEPDPEGELVRLADWSRIQAVAAAASIDQASPIYGGVYFDDGAAAATDFYRLAWTDTETPERPMNIPARAIRALTEAPRTAVTDGRIIKGATEDGAWWSRLIEGAFPKWRSLIPTDEATTRITVRSEALADVLGRAGLVLDAGWPIFLETGEGELIVKNGQDGARFSEAVEAKIEGDAITVAYNPTYLAEAVAPVEEATISIISAVKPARIEGEDWWNAMLMPIRI